MSELSEIRYMVEEQRRINRELNDEISVISSGIVSAYNSWTNLCSNISSTLNAGAQRVNNSQGAIEAAHQMQGEIDKLYVLFKNIEQANKRIRELNNKKIYDFANYTAVRKIVSAMLDNLENNFVSDKTITKSIEVKHLQLPDYWLTCALLSIMAWRNDNKQLANQALERACKLDKKEAAVFFLAFNLRMGRESAALKWFNFYRTCELAGEDDRTFMLLFAITNRVIKENCSDEVVNEVRAFINQVIEDDMNNNGYNEDEVVSRIGFYLRRFIPDDSLKYTVLVKHCLERDYLKRELMLAKANIGILDFILKTVNYTDEDRKDYLNSFIEGVVKKPNSVELEVEDEIKYNELVIKYQGDVERAQTEYERIRTHREEDFDIIVEMIDWVYKSNQEDEVNPVVKANLLSMTKDLNEKACRRHFDSYKQAYKTTYAIKIDDYETTANLNDANGECSKLRSYIDTKKANALASIKTWLAFIGFGLGLLAAGGGGYFAVSGSMGGAVPLFILALAGVIFGVIHILVCNSKKSAVERDHENEYANKEHTLKNMMSEFVMYTNELTEYDSYSGKILEEFSKM